MIASWYTYTPTPRKITVVPAPNANAVQAASTSSSVSTARSDPSPPTSVPAPPRAQRRIRHARFPNAVISTAKASSIDTTPVRPSRESVTAAVGSRNNEGAGPKYMYQLPSCS